MHNQRKNKVVTPQLIQDGEQCIILIYHLDIKIELCFTVFQELSLRLAEREKACIVVATDPDADRLAVAEQNDK